MFHGLSLVISSIYRFFLMFLTWSPLCFLRKLVCEIQLRSMLESFQPFSSLNRLLHSYGNFPRWIRNHQASWWHSNWKSHGASCKTDGIFHHTVAQPKNFGCFCFARHFPYLSDCTVAMELFSNSSHPRTVPCLERGRYGQALQIDDLAAI